MPKIYLVVSILLLSALLNGCFSKHQASDSSSSESVPTSDMILIAQKGEPHDFPDIAAGAGHSCLVTTTGRIECWGGNQFGQLGGSDGPFTLLENGPPFSGNPGSWAKANVRGLTGKALAVSSGYYHTCALVGVGGVQCWGRNISGQLGDGTNIDSDTAVHVQGMDVPVVAIDLGVSHSCALLEAGKVRCWGDNEYGQLGNGTRENSNIPVAVHGLPDKVVQIAAGGMFTCALTEDGRIYCWGNALTGRIGEDTRDSFSTPELIDGLEKDIDLIVAGDYHLCVRSTSGEILCWGALSSKDEFTARTPFIVEELTGTVAQMAAGGGYSCALTVADGVKCWGDNYFGQLGNGTDLGSWEPVDAIGAADNVLRIASGSGHVCALKMDGGVKCWGDCSTGQCGDSALQWAWSSYTNQKYYFSIDYPGWNVMEVPNPDYPTEVDQVWFASSSFPPAQTNARPDIALWITEEDPTPNWDARFFDNYKVEMIWLGNVSALRISGTNKESLQDERVIIVRTGDFFIQAIPNQSVEAQRYFDQMIYTLNITWDLLTVPAVVP
jgi:alpha-tubulin suppressor-like RCC1 family protein